MDKLADHFSLTDAELDERLPSGYKRFYHRCSRAMLDLKLKGCVASQRRAYWKITAHGRINQNKIVVKVVGCIVFME